MGTVGVKQPFNDHLTGAFSLNRKRMKDQNQRQITGGQVVCEMDAKKRLRHSIEKGRIAAELQKLLLLLEHARHMRKGVRVPQNFRGSDCDS